jgi:hypothetical protein
MLQDAVLIGVGLALAAGLEFRSLRGYGVAWQVGVFDDSSAEFALAPGDVRRFTERFPQDPVYTIGKSTPADWPFIHPNEADTAWGGARYHEFKIRFDLDRTPTGRWALLVRLTDAHENMPPQMVLRVNGHEHVRQVEAGNGRAYFGDVSHGKPQSVWFTIDADELKSGANEMAIGLRGGSWVAYDAIALLRREGTATAGRRPSWREHAFMAMMAPLHKDFAAPTGWEGNMLACEGQGGWLYLFGTRGKAAGPVEGLVAENFSVGFDLRPAQGAMALEFAAPQAARPYWRVEWRAGEICLAGASPMKLPAGTWRIEVQSAPEHVVLTVGLLDGPTQRQEVALPGAGPEGRLRFVVLDELGQSYVTNLNWTLPVTLRARIDGQAARVVARAAVPHGEVSATARLLAPDGHKLASRSAQWPAMEEDVEVSLPLKAGAAAARAVLELRQAGRRGPIVTAEAPVVTPRAPRPADKGRPPGAYVLETKEGLVAGNEAYEVLVPAGGKAGPALLVSRHDGVVLADHPYSYGFDGREGPVEVVERKAEKDRKGAVNLTLRLRAGDLTVTHCLIFPPGDESFAERLSFSAGRAADLRKVRCGWVRSLKDLEPSNQPVLMPAPWREDTWGGQKLDDLTPAEAVWLQGYYRATGGPEREWVPEHGSEGWIWHCAKGGTAVVKYNEDFMEWSLIDRVERDGELQLRFGGCGAWHDDPEKWGQVPAGQEVVGGWTYYLGYRGAWQEGFYRFREFMARQGHGCPFNFAPPVHWNELYDNKLWWGPDTAERRKKFYGLDDILWEAQKARDAGCQALYLDPGWDTQFGSHLWDEARLLPAAQFVKRVRDEYGLKVSLHTPLAGCASGAGGGLTYPKEAWRVDEGGHVIEGSLCSGAKACLDEEGRRLLALADAGIAYFMFDGSAYAGPCFSHDHGHPVPYTRDDQIKAYQQLGRMIHEKHPEVIIEQHDQVLGGVHSVYTPVYAGHAQRGWDERWAKEYMWAPLQVLKDRRAISLYYYNLAYHLPQYIHIDLRDDNEHCLALWWYASTCRHLGLGGTHPDGRNWLTVQRHMAEYLRLQDYFKRGVFYGLEEEVHVHVLPEKGAVINVFNLSDRPVRKRFTVDLARVGLAPQGRVHVRGGEHVRLGDRLEIQVELQAWDQRIVEVQVGK